MKMGAAGWDYANLSGERGFARRSLRRGLRTAPQNVRWYNDVRGVPIQIRGDNFMVLKAAPPLIVEVMDELVTAPAATAA